MLLCRLGFVDLAAAFLYTQTSDDSYIVTFVVKLVINGVNSIPIWWNSNQDSVEQKNMDFHGGSFGSLSMENPAGENTKADNPQNTVRQLPTAHDEFHCAQQTTAKITEKRWALSSAP